MAQIKAATLSNAGKNHVKIIDSFLSGGFVPDRFSLETAGHHSISHFDDPRQAAQQLMSAALEQDDQANVTLTVAVFSELPEPHPGYPQSTAELARFNQTHPHIEHHNREMPGKETRQVKDEDNAQPGRMSFWTVIPGWLRIVLLIFFFLVIVFLGWAYAAQLFA